MLDGLFGRGFSAKCKFLIKASRARIQMVRRRVEAKQRFLKEDLAKLLSNGLEVNAYERMEEFVAGMTLLSFYDFVERACEHIMKQASKMQKLGDCPEECREDVSLLMFAAARFADLPELRDLRDIFRQRYGPCLEVSSNQKFVERLSPAPPTTEKKIQVMQNIAAEFSIKWDAKGFEQRMVNPRCVVPTGLPRADKMKQKPDLPFAGRQGNYGDNNSKWRREEAERHRGKDSIETKQHSVLKEDVSKFLAGHAFSERQTLSKSKHANLVDEEVGKELKVQNLDISSQGKMQNRDDSMKMSNGKPKPVNGGSTEPLQHERIEFSSVRGEHSDGKKNATSSQRQTDQDKMQNAATEKQEKKTDEIKSFSNHGIPPPYLKAKDNVARPPYTKPKEHRVKIHGGPKSAASDMDFQFVSQSSDPVAYATGNSAMPLSSKDPSSEKVVRTVGIEIEHQDQNIPFPKQSARRKHHRSSSSSRVIDTHDDGTLNGNSSSSKNNNHSGKGLQVLFNEEEHHRKDEEEILMDKLLLHYSKKPSLYDAENIPKKSGGRPPHDDGRYVDDAKREEVPAPSRSASLPREPTMTSSSTGTKKVLNRASTFQPDNQANHVHPKLPDYDDLAAKFAALRGR